MKDGAPTFGLWYDFRQRLPFTEKYEDFYAECLEEIEEGERWLDLNQESAAVLCAPSGYVLGSPARYMSPRP